MKKLAGIISSALAAASIVALAPSTASAQTCEESVSDGALAVISAGTSSGTGARFVTDSIRWAFDLSALDIAALWGSTSPSSHVYYGHIQNSWYFVPVTGVVNTDGDAAHADNIGAGDILVIDAAGTYSGHSVVIMGAPEVLSSPQNPVVSGTTQWMVPIADHTTSTHGCVTIGSTTYADSRGCGTTGSPFLAGAGTAYMRIYTDNTTGDFVGYNWRANSSYSSYYAMTSRAFIVGGVDPCPLPDLVND